MFCGTFGTKGWIEKVMKMVGAGFETFEGHSKQSGLTRITLVATVVGGVDALREHNLTDVRLANGRFGPPVIRMWEKVRPVIDGIGRSGRQTRLLSWLGYLYHRLDSSVKEHPAYVVRDMAMPQGTRVKRVFGCLRARSRCDVVRAPLACSPLLPDGWVWSRTGASPST